MPDSHTEPVNNNGDMTTTQTAAYNRRAVLLQTASSSAVSNNGELVPDRALLDSGSQRSYITLKLKNRLGLNAVRKESVSLNVFGS